MTELLKQQTPPLLHGPSAKEKKYDRQLRLWAANGQQALEDSHILLLNSGSGTVGAETLKNLVLPGVGKFTIADEAIVTEDDLGVNFFLDEEHLGQPRAAACARLLQELNPDVEAGWWPQSATNTPEELFASDVDHAFTLIIYTHPISSPMLDLVKSYSLKHRVPSIAIHTTGFFSYFTIHLPGNFPIVDTHPDSTATTDLRLLNPWPELQQFTESLTANIDSLSAHDHGHIPYLILLLYYLEEWKKEHGGEPPKTYKEKTAFRLMVAQAARTDNPEGGEENYDEAVGAVLKNISASTISSSVREVFDYVPNDLEAASSFWIITSAVKRFYERHGVLPVPGSIPDMKAQSSVYVALQRLYKNKARADVAEVVSLLQCPPRTTAPSTEEVESYCKNAAFIKLIRGSEATPEALQKLADQELNAEFALAPTLIPVYMALRASELALASSESSSISTDEVLSELTKLVSVPSNDERISKAIAEVLRAKGTELHNISSLVGGMVAQEVIKLLTKQYVPIDNTCVFDGISSRSQTFRI